MMTCIDCRDACPEGFKIQRICCAGSWAGNKALDMLAPGELHRLSPSCRGYSWAIKLPDVTAVPRGV